MDELQFCADSRRMLCEPNAGGSSLMSEVLSLEVYIIIHRKKKEIMSEVLSLEVYIIIHRRKKRDKRDIWNIIVSVDGEMTKKTIAATLNKTMQIDVVFFSNPIT